MAELTSSEDGIRKLNEKLAAICGNLPIKPGVIQMLAYQYYPAWGIDMTGDNFERVKNDSTEGYHAWTIGTSESNRAIGRAIKSIGLEQGDMELNKGVAELIVDILLSLDDGVRHFTLTDLGAGTGNTTDTILEVMGKTEGGRSLASRCTFELVELSWDRLSEAQEKLGKNTINDAVRKLRVNRHCESLEKYLSDQKTGNLNAIISSGALHHCSQDGHFYEMHRVLDDEGVLVIGDWHNNLFSHPANLIELLGRLEASEEHIREFKRQFDVTEADAVRFEKGLTKEEKIANKHFADFIVAMGNEFRRIDERDRLPFFEALESVNERLNKIKKAGFVTDIEELREKHRGFLKIMDPEKGDLVKRIYPKTTVACIMGAGKIAK